MGQTNGKKKIPPHLYITVQYFIPCFFHKTNRAGLITHKDKCATKKYVYFPYWLLNRDRYNYNGLRNNHYKILKYKTPIYPKQPDFFHSFHCSLFCSPKWNTSNNLSERDHQPAGRKPRLIGKCSYLFIAPKLTLKAPSILQRQAMKTSDDSNVPHPKEILNLGASATWGGPL